MSEILNFDCIVIGGGLSGLTTTLALSKIGLAIAIIDKTSLEATRKNDGDQRTTAISASGKNSSKPWTFGRSWKTVLSQFLILSFPKKEKKVI